MARISFFHYSTAPVVYSTEELRTQAMEYGRKADFIADGEVGAVFTDGDDTAIYYGESYSSLAHDFEELARELRKRATEAGEP